MHKNAIAIFVKTPGRSPIKTRLAADIGEDAALEFYRLCLDSARALAGLEQTKIYWAIAEKDALNDLCWQDFDRIWTGANDLGNAQHNVYSALKDYHENVMLIGADCPQMSAPYIINGFEAFSHYDFVIGPAEDGGYTMFAGRSIIPASTWESVTYSADTTAKELSDALTSKPFVLPYLSDVDTVDDLSKVLQQMPEKPNEAQKKIITWIEKLLRDRASTAA